ncbi:hypothetical protein AB0A69_05100 [Streptomyces sp. NPDC045431]|uniref:hypothetical protein n=1 Tax=Streptomyces sp. NPDC045431 TaxID=3155613 RepID=UPI0033C40709
MGTGRGTGLIRYGWWAALLVAALLCGAAGWSYARTAGDEDRAYAEARDTALATGQRHLAVLNSPGRRAWLEVSAGELREELSRTGPTSDASGTSVRATVTDAALTAFDHRAGTARLIATVRVETGPSARDRRRLEAELLRTPDGWKVTALTAVPAAGA